jgi:TPR repeat protein
MNTLMIFTLLALAARIALQRTARAMASDEEPPNPLQEAAEAGDREAMYRLGWALEHGHGLPADPLEAASWYRRAADEGHDQAAAGLKRVLASDDYSDARFMAEDREAYDHDLSMVAAVGLPPIVTVYPGRPGDPGLKVDTAELLKGVKERDPEQILHLSALFSTRVIKTRDPAVTARWCRRAAVRGVAPAMATYAVCHMSNQADTPRDLKEAIRWLKKSAAGGFTPAKYGLWALHEKSPGLIPFDEAIAYLREAAEDEQGPAQLAYGQMLLEGRQVPYDEELGRSFIEKAAKNKALPARIELPRKPTRGQKPSTGAKPGSPKPRSPKPRSTKKTKGPKRKKRR